ncbi:anhydro-N-acetylmuramic acid kinase [Chromobacterium aquaticum]|uniref:Anhydro-N-acetylmuramic acid kinase n=1 Tax=Chromobacterium aquaticum TaxID=467180 RepID=A0ABV8ZTA7_9NEIS|nr:anhydro-N-acetylmuramic acid kinase [Chromobacterium aquaticum]MCD5363691.1 anhydro-N-acetylmuramic acid kinase [Chromobacterium aquaticum]
MNERLIGLMSGTSLDGVDAVLVRFDEQGAPSVEADHFLAYPPRLREQALALQARGDNELDRAARLANELAELYAQAVNGLLAAQALAPADIAAVACHGQTIRHAPDAGYTWQAGNMARLAELTGIDVIADFRSRDLAAGGQGAPLVPAFHQAVFGAPRQGRVILNIGGISNLTRLHPDLPVIGFDCGPGNMLMDAWCLHHQGSPYDADGQWAAQGQVDASLLQTLLAESFFLQPPPKSTGRDLFDLPWLEQKLLGRHVPAVDVQATLLELSALSIAQAITLHCPSNQAVYVCGGGARNGALMRRLTALLPQQRITGTAELGLPEHQVEAAAFAWLGWRFLRRQAGNLPEVTGAAGERVLGALYPR